MIPARISCPASWTLEYNGYLMSEHKLHHRNSVECVDKDAEAITGLQADIDAALFYFMEAVCSGLSCPLAMRSGIIIDVIMMGITAENQHFLHLRQPLHKIRLVVTDVGGK